MKVIDDLAAATVAARAAITTPPRLGFLGVGWIGTHRMRCIAESGIAAVAALADASPASLAGAAAVAPGATVAASLDALLDLDLDGIVIATPSAQHAAQAIAALERGVAVFCQKPLGRTADETRRVVDAARAADRLLGVDLSYRHTAAMQSIRPFVHDAALGRVFAVDLVFHNAYGPDKPWFYDPASSGGGCVIDLGIHLVDLALWCLAFPRVTSVTSRLFSKGAPLVVAKDRVEDYAVARLDLEDGTTIRLACSWNLSAGQDAVIGATFYGSEGAASMSNVGGSFYDLRAERFRGTSRETLVEPPDAWGGRAAVEWAERLAAGARFDSEADRLVDVAEVIDRIYRR
jgi:predicted dehydrogenase